MMHPPFDRPWLHPESADPDGLAGVGGELSPRTLLLAYAEGVFPWFSHDDPILWWSPDPRGIFEFDRFHVPRRLDRVVRQNRFTVTINQCFRKVMQACGEERPEGTWVTPSMLEGYSALHRIGHAHSVEAWQNGELVGGVYGVSLGALFAAESMFHRVTDAGSVALVHLVRRLRQRGYELLDIQMTTDHTRRFGAVAIPRAEYLTRLRKAIGKHEIKFV